MAKILCIEDETDYREGLVDFLSHAGFEVDEAADGEEGMKKAICGDHDLILCDIKMPKKNGYDVLREVQERTEDFSRKPFIFLSAYGHKDNLISALSQGASYLVKPVDFDLLLTKIKAKLNTFDQIAKLAVKKERLSRNSIICSLRADIGNPLQMIHRFSEIIMTQELGEISNKKYVGFAKLLNESSYMLAAMINEITEASADAGIYASGEATADAETILWKVKSRLENIHNLPQGTAKLSITEGDKIIAANPDLVARMVGIIASSISRQMGKPQKISIAVNAGKYGKVCFSVSGMDFEDASCRNVFLKELIAMEAIAGSLIIPLEFAEDVTAKAGGSVELYMDSVGNIKAAISLPAVDRE